MLSVQPREIKGLSHLYVVEMHAKTLAVMHIALTNDNLL